MDAPAAPKIRFNPLLPYWAVLQTDLRQTLHSGVYRLWVVMAVVAVGGSVVYKLGAHQLTGMTQYAADHGGTALRGLVVGSLGLVALLAVAGIGGERATVADAILSRGISRHQYFLAKWHARLAVILGTFLALAGITLLALHYLFADEISLTGGVVAVATVTAALAVVVTCGVTIGALTHGTVMGITLFWVLLYGSIVGVSLLPESHSVVKHLLLVERTADGPAARGGDGSPTADRVFGRLKNVLGGKYDKQAFSEVLILSGGLCTAAAAVGMVGFGRKDV
jgi:ABC-2 type transport system permease protein